MGMSAEPRRKGGVFFLGAAVLSMLLPGRARRQERPVETAPVAPAAAPPRAPRRMWALVQTDPAVMVLAVSASRAELERELAEINETWNHWELRSETRRYAIQPAPVLFPAQPEPGAPAPPVRPVGNEAG
jgi:hypothetical protein